MHDQIKIACLNHVLVDQLLCLVLLSCRKTHLLLKGSWMDTLTLWRISWNDTVLKNSFQWLQSVFDMRTDYVIQTWKEWQITTPINFHGQCYGGNLFFKVLNFGTKIWTANFCNSQLHMTDDHSNQHFTGCPHFCMTETTPRGTNLGLCQW